MIKDRIRNALKKHDSDTGSSAVQIGNLCLRVYKIREHISPNLSISDDDLCDTSDEMKVLLTSNSSFLKSNKKDYKAPRAIHRCIASIKKFLSYLYNNDLQEYHRVIAVLKQFEKELQLDYIGRYDRSYSK